MPSSHKHATRTRRNFVKAVGAGTLITGTAGCLGSFSGGAGVLPVKVGAAVGLTGELAKFGELYKNQAEQHTLPTVVNKESEKIEFIIEDTQTSPQAGVSAAQKLVNQENVKQLSAGVSSGVSIAIAESVAIPDSIFTSVMGTSSKITDLNDDGYVWRTSPPSQFQARALATHVMDNDVGSVSIIFVNNDYGSAIADEFASSYETLGGTVEYQSAYEQGKSSYQTQLESAMKSDPEGLVFVSYPKAFNVMAREAFEMGIKDEVKGYFAPETIVGAEVTENLPPKSINGMKGTQPSPPETDAYKRYKQHNMDAMDREPIIWEGYWFDLMILHSLATIKAIEQKGEYTTANLRDAVYEVSRPEGTSFNFWEYEDAVSALQDGEEINYEGATGSVDLNPKGDTPGTYRHWVVKDGSFVTKDFIELPDELS